MKVKSESEVSHVRLLATPWTAPHQAPLPMGFSRQKYWSGVPLPSPCLYYHLLIHLSISEPLGCFQQLVIVNKAAVNMDT